MSVGTFSRGRPVYGNGSHAPNRGPVSSNGAKGYLKRSLNKGGSNLPNKGNGSQQRSGVASASLQRMKGKQAKLGVNPGRPIVKQPAVKPSSGNPAIKPVTDSAPVPPPTPTVRINSTGQLELPYNSQLGQNALQGLESMNSELLGLQEEGQQQALEYASGKRNLNQQYGALQQNTLNDNAARGTAFSSGYGAAVGRNANSYNNELNDLELQNTNFQNSTIKRRSAIETAFNNMLRQQALQAAEEAAQDAGNLGFGTTEPTTVMQPPTPASKPKPKPKSKPKPKTRFKSRTMAKHNRNPVKTPNRGK